MYHIYVFNQLLPQIAALIMFVDAGLWVFGRKGERREERTRITKRRKEGKKERFIKVHRAKDRDRDM